MLSFYGKFLDFVARWRGKRVDEDGAYAYQCIDIARQFVKEQYGVKLSHFSGSALNGWKTGSPFNKRWKRIVYAPGLVPDTGDVVFLDKTRVNPYGHVCIAEVSDANRLQVIEQNGGAGK